MAGKKTLIVSGGSPFSKRRLLSRRRKVGSASRATKRISWKRYAKGSLGTVDAASPLIAYNIGIFVDTRLDADPQEFVRDVAGDLSRPTHTLEIAAISPIQDVYCPIKGADVQNRQRFFECLNGAPEDLLHDLF